MTLRDDLIAAKALIDTPDKWCKGRMYSRDGRMCAFGALYCGFRSRDEDYVDALMLLNAQSPKGRLSAFNDAPETTHADIMALFDRAIEAAS